MGKIFHTKIMVFLTPNILKLIFKISVKLESV